MTETLATTPIEAPKATRRCSALNKAGEPCGTPPLKGSSLCSVHDPASPVASRFAPGHAPTPNGGRPAKQRAIDVLREQIEAQVAAVVTPYFDALGASTGYGEADHAMRVKAAEALLDRAYGKPRQQVEHSGPDGGPITLAHLAQRADEDEA